MVREKLLVALAVVCLLVAVGAVGYGAGKASDVPEVVRAQRFEVVDGEGRVRWILGVSGLDPILFMVGRDGKQVRAELSMAPDGNVRLGILDRQGELRAMLQGPGLSETGNDGWGRSAEPSLVLSDQDGKVLWSAP